MKNLFTFLFVTLISVTGLFGQANDADDASFVKDWAAPLPTWFAKLPAEEPARAQATSSFIADFDASAGFDASWDKISGEGFPIAHQLGLSASATGPEDFKDAAFKSCYDGSYIYILLKYTDDDVTGEESVEVAWAPYLKINAPELASLPQAWYARYQQFGAYKATFKKTGFDAAMMIDGSTGSINWGGTNEILSNNLYLNDHTTAGSRTVKQIITIGFPALTGEARPDFDQDIWAMLNEGKGISLDLKVNDKDGNDALKADGSASAPAEYWWNSTHNDAYALTAYAGFLDNKGTITNVSALETERSIFGMTYSQKIQLTRNANVLIYNTLGQPIKSFKNVNIVDLSDLKSGIYIVRANNEVKKFFR